MAPLAQAFVRATSHTDSLEASSSSLRGCFAVFRFGRTWHCSGTRRAKTQTRPAPYWRPSHMLVRTQNARQPAYWW